MKNDTLKKRMKKAQEKMSELGIEAMFLSPGANLEYLTGSEDASLPLPSSSGRMVG
ncbi:MAG: aminopeptidase P family N-terminal domain-containing protein [Chloroflexi bacterium]|nr:aminopeptidase P family N-terminal domain-containing protein [Chloroflexota bacterium]